MLLTTLNLTNYGENRILEHGNLDIQITKHRLTTANINSSELSKEVRRIKGEGSNLAMKWRIIKHRAASNPVTNPCNLCLSEKLYILEYEGSNLLNKLDELISKCRHRNKYILLHHDSRD